MSKAKWVCGKEASTGEIIAKSANQIVPPKFRRVEGGSGDETSQCAD